MSRDSTGFKVEITFGCLVALLIGVGWLGLSRMGRMYAASNEILNQGVLKLQLASEAVFYVNSNFRLVTILVLTPQRSPEDIDSNIAKREENLAKGAAAKEHIREIAVSEKEKELLAQIDQIGVISTSSVTDLLNLMRKPGKEHEAQLYAAAKTVPLMNQYREAWAAFIKYQETQIDLVRARNEANFAATRDLTASLVLAAIVLAIAIAAVAIRRMNIDHKERETSKEAIRKLNEELEKKVAARTEELAHTVDVLRGEVNVRSAQEGDLRRLAAIVESSDDAIVAITLDGIITDWNPGAERMFGYSQVEIIGKTVAQILPPDRLGEPSRNLERLIEGDRVVRHETVRVRKDGKEIHVAMTISPLRDSRGRIFGDTAIFRDITERKKADAAHRRSEASFRSFVQNAPYGILRTTPDGRIMQANPALVEMLGYSSEQEVLGLNMVTDVYRNPGDRQEATLWYRHHDSVQGVEVEWKHKSGRPFTIRCAANVVKDSEGRIEFLEGFIEDISERRALEQQLRQGQKMEAIGLLAGGIAHDFNNLLGVISGYAELVWNQMGQDSDARGSVEQIRKAAERAASLTRQLLAFSRQQVLETKVLNINSIIEDMYEMLPRLLGEDIELQLSLDSALGSVKADQGQIEQVIMNLVVNARDAMPGGGRLTIATARAASGSGISGRHSAMAPGNYIVLSVTDNGTGMDKQTQTHIFEPFFTTKERGRGTGLGLATIYGFVKQIGGYVWVESEPGAGSTFTIYLPATSEKSPQIAATPVVAVPERGSGTILLVEDEEALRTLTRNLLEQSGYTVLEAANGMEAVEIARNHSGLIELVLSDMVMPGMNGQAVAKKVGEFFPEIKVAYMSGYTGISTREAAGLNAVLIAKPFTRSELLQKIGEALEQECKPVQA